MRSRQLPALEALACTVRGCGLPLTSRRPEAQGPRPKVHGHGPKAQSQKLKAQTVPTLICRRGHSYDAARSGYINLLQPQDRKSPQAGDTRTAVEARARLLEQGVGRALVQAITSLAADAPAADAIAVDLGCGSGEALDAVTRAATLRGIGIDLSVAAIDRAARRFPALTWVVANADRRLPLLDGSVGLVLSLHARRNPVECARVLAPGGRLIVAVPAPDDLAELRRNIQGDAVERDRTAPLIAEHEPQFTVSRRTTIRERHHLRRDALLDLLQGTYRGVRASAIGRVAELDAMEVTLASDVVVLTPRAG